MRILVVCGSGLGSSLIMEMNIKKVLAALGVEAEVNHTDLTTSKTEKADYYIGTPEMVEQLDDGQRKLIPIKNIFSIPEVELALKKYLF